MVIIDPLILESHIIPIRDGVPKAAIELYLAEIARRIPTAIAEYGGRFFVIQTSGQGPYIIWEEPS